MQIIRRCVKKRIGERNNGGGKKHKNKQSNLGFDDQK
jgi:hypothetical protein